MIELGDSESLVTVAWNVPVISTLMRSVGCWRIAVERRETCSNASVHHKSHFYFPGPPWWQAAC